MRSIRRPSISTRPISRACSARPWPPARSVSCWSSSTAWIGKPPRPPQSTRRARSATPKGAAQGCTFRITAATTTDYGYFVSSPASDSTGVDADAADRPGKCIAQFVRRLQPRHGGPTPWSHGDDPAYLIGKSREGPHAVTDSAASATSLKQPASRRTTFRSISIRRGGRRSQSRTNFKQADTPSASSPACRFAMPRQPAPMPTMFPAMTSRTSPAISSGYHRSRIASSRWPASMY